MKLPTADSLSVDMRRRPASWGQTGMIWQVWLMETAEFCRTALFKGGLADSAGRRTVKH